MTNTTVLTRIKNSAVNKLSTDVNSLQSFKKYNLVVTAIKNVTKIDTITDLNSDESKAVLSLNSDLSDQVFKAQAEVSNVVQVQ